MLENQDKIVWNQLCENEGAIDKNKLSGNPEAIELCYNINARELLINNLDKVYWKNLSTNPGMIDILMKMKMQLNI